MSEEAYSRAGSKDKKYHKLKNATHIQIYYKKEVVDEALEELRGFFKGNL